MGWCHARVRRYLCVLRYWNRLLRLDESRITKKVFNTDFAKNSVWCQQVNNILYSIGLGNMYANKCILDLDNCKKKLQDSYDNVWKEDIQDKPKLCTRP